MHAAGKTFVETYLKAIRDTFFPNMWKVQTFMLAGRPSSLSGTSWFPHEENPEGGWSAYCNDFLSKQKIYSM